jgi:hypothetical protein
LLRIAVEGTKYLFVYLRVREDFKALCTKLKFGLISEAGESSISNVNIDEIPADSILRDVLCLYYHMYSFYTIFNNEPSMLFY